MNKQTNEPMALTATEKRGLASLHSAYEYIPRWDGYPWSDQKHRDRCLKTSCPGCGERLRDLRDAESHFECIQRDIQAWESVILRAARSGLLHRRPIADETAIKAAKNWIDDWRRHGDREALRGARRGLERGVSAPYKPKEVQQYGELLKRAKLHRYKNWTELRNAPKVKFNLPSHPEEFSRLLAKFDLQGDLTPVDLYDSDRYGGVLYRRLYRELRRVVKEQQKKHL